MSHISPSEQVMSCHTQTSIMSHKCNIYEWDMSQIWTRHVKCMKESCHTCHTHTCHTHTSHTHTCHTHTCHTHQSAMSHMSMRHATHLKACVWHDSFTREAFPCVTWLNRMCDIPHVRDVTHFCVTYSSVWSILVTHTHTPTHVTTSYPTCHPPVDWVIHQKWAASRFGIQFKTSKRYRLTKTSQPSAQQSFQMANWVTNWPFKQIFTKALYLDIR